MKFSILIPVFKEKFLVDAIDSILSQSYQDWELVILNDHSPFDIESIVTSYKDDRIKYFENEKNVGAINVVNNWNKCLSYSTGDYVICMGDDDILHRECLNIYAEYIDKYPDVHAFHSRSIIIDETGSERYVTDSRAEWESVYALMIHRMREEQFIGDFCLKATTLKEAGGYYNLPLAWGSDDVSAYLCAQKGGVVNVQKPVFYYRKSTINITSTGNVKLKLDALLKLEMWYDKFLEEKPAHKLEMLERELVIARIDKYFFKRKADDLSVDFSRSAFNFLKWLCLMRKYRISCKILFFSLLLSVGKKL